MKFELVVCLLLVLGIMRWPCNYECGRLSHTAMAHNRGRGSYERGSRTPTTKPFVAVGLSSNYVLGSSMASIW